MLLFYSLLGGGSAPEPPPLPDQSASTISESTGQLNVPSPPQSLKYEADEGIRAFLQHWEMNDLAFMFVLENLRLQDDVAPERKPWFVFTSDKWSRSILTGWARLRQNWHTETPREEHNLPFTTAQLRTVSFSLARLITGVVFAIIACSLAWIAAGRDDPQAWCRATMLTLAWFWLTCPTQNPWYWCWVLPFLPFARYRTWYVVAAMTMLYYLRFWLTAHSPQPPVFGTPYSGAYFFYFVIVWIEFGPVLVALSWEWLRYRRGEQTR